MWTHRKRSETEILDQSGFTLLETMIAVGIMVVAFASILMVESASIRAIERTRTMNIVSMLAKNAMIDAEQEFQGKTFKEVKEEESERFKAPFEGYRWIRSVKEVEFPTLNFTALAGGEEGGDGNQLTQSLETMTKLLTKFISESIREVTVTIEWQKGKGTQSYSVSTYWVDLNHEFSLQE